MNKDQKRFIAGAVCPRCAELDKIFVYRVEGTSVRECANCDFIEQQQFEPIFQEPATRATRDSGVNQERVVKLVSSVKKISSVKKNPNPDK